MIAGDEDIQTEDYGPIVKGRVDVYGTPLLPITVVASDGFELELEASINLRFTGFLVMPDPLAAAIGLRNLGARRVQIASDTKILSQFLGVVSFGGKHDSISILGGFENQTIIGKRLLAGRRLTIDFSTGEVSVISSQIEPL